MQTATAGRHFNVGVTATVKDTLGQSVWLAIGQAIIKIDAVDIVGIGQDKA